MTRNAAGHVTLEALKAGEKQEYGVVRGGSRHAVILRLAESGRYHVARSVIKDSGLEEAHVWVLDNIFIARERWRAEVRKAKG